MPHRLLPIAAVLISASLATAAEVPTRATLDALLSDGSFLEDFEGLSVHGGSSLSAPSPLNRASQPTWNLLAGPTYTSSGATLSLYGGTLNGDSSNILEAFYGDLDVTFPTPKNAVGLDLVNQAGNIDINYAVTFYSGLTPLGTLTRTAPFGPTFVGWQNTSSGISRVHIVGDPVEEIDNLEWGTNVVPEPATLSLLLMPLTLLRRRRRHSALPTAYAALANS